MSTDIQTNRHYFKNTFSSSVDPKTDISTKISNQIFFSITITLYAIYEKVKKNVDTSNTLCSVGRGRLLGSTVPQRSTGRSIEVSFTSASDGRLNENHPSIQQPQGRLFIRRRGFEWRPISHARTPLLSPNPNDCT